MRHGCFGIADPARTSTSRKAERTGSRSQADINRRNEAGTHGRGSVSRYEPCGVPERGLAQILERVGRQGGCIPALISTIRTKPRTRTAA